NGGRHFSRSIRTRVVVSQCVEVSVSGLFNGCVGLAQSNRSSPLHVWGWVGSQFEPSSREGACCGDGQPRQHYHSIFLWCPPFLSDLPFIRPATYFLFGICIVHGRGHEHYSVSSAGENCPGTQLVSHASRHHCYRLCRCG